jgi:hypothetical protein
MMIAGAEQINLNGHHLSDLTGPDFSLLPYERSVWRDDILVRLWELARNEETLSRIFWWQESKPEAERLELYNFLHYFRKRLLLIAVSSYGSAISARTKRMSGSGMRDMPGVLACGKMPS